MSLANAEPTVSVIILNYNGRLFLQDCLASVLKTSYKHFEVILVDNGSIDHSLTDALKVFGNDPRVRAFRNQENLGYAGGNNSGLLQAKGDLVVFLNNDTKVTPEWLNDLVSAMQSHPDVGVCQSKIRLMGHSNRLDVVGTFLTPYGFLTYVGLGEEDQGQYETPTEIFSAKGACMMVRKSLLDAIGAFDSEFISYFEETDLCWRAWLSGHRILYVPGSVVYHAWGGSTYQLSQARRNALLVFYGFRNRITSQVKNLGPTALVKVFPVHIMVCAVVILWYFRSRRIQEGILVAKAVAWNVINFGSVLRRRMAVQGLRSVPDRVLMPKILRRVSVWDLLRLLEGRTWNALTQWKTSTRNSGQP